MAMWPYYCSTLSFPFLEGQAVIISVFKCFFKQVVHAIMEWFRQYVTVVSYSLGSNISHSQNGIGLWGIQILNMAILILFQLSVDD